MYPPLKCKHCNKSLGEYFADIKAIRTERIEKKAAEEGIAIENIALSPKGDVKMGDVLAQFFIVKDCCIITILTCAEFKDYYNR